MSGNSKQVSSEEPKAPLGQALKAGFWPLVTIGGMLFGPSGLFTGGALGSLVSDFDTGTVFQQPDVQAFYGMAMGWLRHLYDVTITKIPELLKPDYPSFDDTFRILRELAEEEYSAKRSRRFKFCAFGGAYVGGAIYGLQGVIIGSILAVFYAEYTSKDREFARIIYEMKEDDKQYLVKKALEIMKRYGITNLRGLSVVALQIDLKRELILLLKNQYIIR